MIGNQCERLDALESFLDGSGLFFYANADSIFLAMAKFIDFFISLHSVGRVCEIGEGWYNGLI